VQGSVRYEGSPPLLTVEEEKSASMSKMTDPQDEGKGTERLLGLAGTSKK
jgi:hypothetical protein